MKSTHYHTLGLPVFASLNEVKQAYRKLAKQYHPDVNPSGKEVFTQISAAYEILGDSSRKYIYDSRLRQELRQAYHPKKSTVKTGTVSEQELRRRQYYQEHYKKHYRQQQQNRQQHHQPKTYNEYKYILFATPIAVTLVLLVLSLYQKTTVSNTPADTGTTIHSLNNGVFPYQSYFGDPVYHNAASRQVVLNNANGQDIVCIILSKKIFHRGCYLRQKYSATIAQLPNDTLTIRYMLGTNWCASCEIQTKKQTITGRFHDPLRFFETTVPPNVTGIIDNVLLSETQTEISPDLFFANGYRNN